MIFGGSRIAAFALMALIWGLTVAAMKLAPRPCRRSSFATVRFLLAGLCFLMIALARGLPLRAPRFGRIVVASLLITTGCYAFVFWGVANAPTGISAIVNLALMPIFLVAIGAVYGQERITRRRAGAIGLGILGLVLLFSGGRARPRAARGRRSASPRSRSEPCAMPGAR
jgi:drug/metabolite transporter (DMT)-like permease